ncbi:MAG: short-chain alcohol dehydrogenase [Acidimicrobiales bacterium]|nr:short-chain alcohol dehydrogenase [Acidimicrobiales bacterium]
MTGSGLAGRRVLVFGASSGLGRSIALDLVGRSARVAMAARRVDRLAGSVAAAVVAAGDGADCFAVGCDVTNAAQVRAAVEEVVEHLGGLDALVYASAIGRLVRLADASADDWAYSFATNVTGAALVTAACLPHLESARGHALFLSSVSASQTAPWPGLGLYATSKAALDKLVEAWAIEHPTVAFTRVVSGDCAGGPGDSTTQFADGWDPALATELFGEWAERGLLSGALVDVEDLAATVASVLSSGAQMPSVVVTPRP